MIALIITDRELTQALYEDKVLGSVPEAVYKSLMVKYESERVEKQELMQSLKQRLADTAQDEQDIEQYIQSIKKYVAIEQLDREMLLELQLHRNWEAQRDRRTEMPGYGHPLQSR